MASEDSEQLGPGLLAVQVLAVVVMPPIGDHLAHPKEALEVVEAGYALRALRNYELVSHLIAGL